MAINCKGKLIDLNIPKVMGILNLTPDSFYDGGKYKNESDILKQTEKMLEDGATFIDVGAYSSRPGAQHISVEEELKRILPVVEVLQKEFPDVILSIDTFRSVVAQKTIEAGAAMINDISAGNLDEQMISKVGKLKVPYIAMHMKGNPQNMVNKNDYEDLTKDLIYYFSAKIKETQKAGIHDVIIDPGFGFAKNIAQNFQLLNNLELFSELNTPLLVGVSRKSMIYKTLNTSAENALNGTSSLNTIALMKGAKILRVHDVKEAVECVKLHHQLNN